MHFECRMCAKHWLDYNLVNFIIIKSYRTIVIYMRLELAGLYLN